MKTVLHGVGSAAGSKESTVGGVLVQRFLRCTHVDVNHPAVCHDILERIAF